MRKLSFCDWVYIRKILKMNLCLCIMYFKEKRSIKNISKCLFFLKIVELKLNIVICIIMVYVFLVKYIK